MPTRILQDGTIQFDFQANPMQRGFITSRAKADLYSSRRGEGKSTGLVWSILYHTQHNPGAKWAVVRDTFENLQKTTLQSFFEWFPPGHAGDYHITNKIWTWKEGLAKGTVSFVGMDDPSDTSKFLSWELGGIAMDEPAPAAGSMGIREEVFDLGSTSLRQPGMNWYPMKLAENNPDESHWTYKKFVEPGMPDFMLWQPVKPENLQNLPSDYYERMRVNLAHRPDLVRRFVDGEFGFQQEGSVVTPQWSDRVHLVTGLKPLPRYETICLWDFGHNPTCIITQRTPLGYWNILDSMVGEDIGVEELIVDWVKPLLGERYRNCPLRHIGDPAGSIREQTSIERSAVRVIRQAIGGTWRAGPVRLSERVDPARAILTRTIQGRGLVQVDKQRAPHVWYALRGGWHFHVAKTGVISLEPKKNIHSHPGDAFAYGAAVLFPLGRLMEHGRVLEAPAPAYFETDRWVKPTYMPSHGEALPGQDSGDFSYGGGY